MAKVLACPSCGYKHSLEILIGLDSFQCHDCGRKLAVPQDAQKLLENRKEIGTNKQKEKLNQNSDRPQSSLKVVAHSSIDLAGISILEDDKDESIENELNELAEENSSPEEFPVVATSVPTSDAASNEASIPAPSGPVVVSRSSLAEGQEPKISSPASQGTKQSEEPKPLSKPVASTKKSPTPPTQGSKTKFPFSIPLVGSVAAWLISIPLAFITVVIIPRLFGFGFHASDFVDVITMQGLGRYKIVVVLVILWSAVTVVCVNLCHFLFRKIFKIKII